MKTERVLYHMARADFLERTRRYSFLAMLGLVLWIGYLSASGQFRMRVPPDYTGAVNSAWVGGTMTVTISFLLGWVGFYLVKGSVSRDYGTGVGQIMATTALSRPLYTLGKWISNFAVLAIMILLLLGEGVIMNLRAGASFDLWALSAPLLFIALPFMALVAAVAVMFETIPWLRGGLGNIVYFFVFLFALIVTGEGMQGGGPASPWADFGGWQLIGRSVAQAAKAAYPESSGGFAFSITPLAQPKLFTWNGLDWTADILLSRLFYLAAAVGIGLLAALFFDRFNPSRLPPVRRKKAEADTPMPAPAVEAAPPASIPLTPLAGGQGGFRFGALFLAELRLLLKGQRLWWYAVAAGLVLAQLFSPVEEARLLLIAAWAWPALIISGLGSRETRFGTRPVVFSAPRPVTRQLTAAWLAALAVLALMGSGALARFVLAGETVSVWGWLTGVIFIPSLALACGVVAGSGKAFEAIYVLWLYLLTQKAEAFDFAGMTPESPWPAYLLAAAGLAALAAFARQRQVTGRNSWRDFA